MARVRDVAAYIISKLRSVDVMKLQKLLLYYSQAWSLVVRKVFKTYQGQYKVSRALGRYDPGRGYLVLCSGRLCDQEQAGGRLTGQSLT